MEAGNSGPPLTSADSQGAFSNGEEMKITVSPYEARDIVRDAYLYGWPLSENYNILHAYALDGNNSEFKAPFNEIHNEARLYGPEDTAVVTPNSDTPYSMLWADLRAEPIVITVPEIRKRDRYFCRT